MPKKSTSKTRKATAFAIFAESLHKMASFYSDHPNPGHIRPIDAIQMVLGDVAGAAEYAAQGKQWVKPGVWKAPK